MIIGIDFDNTIVNTRETSKKYLDIYMKDDKLKDYHDLSKELRHDFLTKYLFKITEDLNVFPDVKETLEYFREKGIKLYLITARGGIGYRGLKKRTKAFLKRNDIVFDKYFFNKKIKSSVCEINNVDLLIDDKDDVLYDANEKGIKVLKYGNKNNDFDYALNWMEVKSYVERMLNEQNN